MGLTAVAICTGSIQPHESPISPSPRRGDIWQPSFGYGVGGPTRSPLSESKTTSKLAATRAAGVERLTKLEEAADSSNRLRPLLVIARRAGRHELVDRGAALTYYSVLVARPGLLVLFSLIGLFGNREHGRRRALGDQGRRAVLERRCREEATRIADQEEAESGPCSGSGIIAVLWTASAYMGSFFRASATIWNVEKRPARRAWPLRMAAHDRLS